MNKHVFYVSIFWLVTGLVGCGGGGGGGNSGGGSQPTSLVQSVSVSPAYVSTNSNTSQQLTATATYADGSTADVTSSVTWASANPTIVSVSNTGLAAANAILSTAQITASMGAAIGTSRVSVTDPAASLISIIVPLNQTIYTGQPWLPTTWADANFSNGTGVSPYTKVKWTVFGCNPANAASVNADGTIAANAPGTCSITASSGALTSAAKTLTIKIPAITSIAIIPSPVSLAVGGNLQLTVMGTYQDGTQKNVTNLVTWSSNNAAAVTVTNTAGNKGLVAGIASGSATVTASQAFPAPASDPVYSPATVSVTVPGSAPVQYVLNAVPAEDNTVMYTSFPLVSPETVKREDRVYPTNAMFNSPAVAVGCAWYYSLVLQQMDASCSEAKLKFNLAALAGKTIISATLRLQASAASAAGVNGIVPRTWIVRALATPWSGTTITWNNSRTLQYYTYSQTAHNPPTYIGQVIEINQTDTVRNWVAGTYQNNGFEMRLGDYSIPEIYTISLDQFEFHSSEDAGNRGPKLIVIYQ